MINVTKSWLEANAWLYCSSESKYFLKYGRFPNILSSIKWSYLYSTSFIFLTWNKKKIVISIYGI